MKASGRRNEEDSRWQMHAHAEGEGRVYQAGRDQHVTVHVHGKQPQPQSSGGVRDALWSLYLLLQLAGTLAFIVGGLIATMTLLKGGLFSTLFIQGFGLTIASFALIAVVERIFTGRWHRWSRPRKRT
jgi:hypothetical protein